MPILTEAERVGTTIAGKYRLDRIIGRGGVGTVFAGVHAWTGREVAVKMLHPQYAEDRSVVDRFLVEARASSTLRHPNVVDVLDMGKDDDGCVYMVLEYLQGESLSRRLERRKRLGAEETAAILLPIMDALVEAHDLDIVHRDIKPENIFLALDAKRRSVPKLLDFGIAKVLSVGSSRATATGMLIGTPAYMSPEQADGRGEVGPRSDIWSMGILFYECLSGSIPFPLEPITATLVAILTTTPAPLKTVAPEVPAALAAAVDRALARAPEQRWPNMQSFAAAVLAAVGPGALERHDPSGAFQSVQATPTSHHAAPRQALPTLPMAAPALAQSKPNARILGAAAVGGVTFLALVVGVLASSRESSLPGEPLPPPPAIDVPNVVASTAPLARTLEPAVGVSAPPMVPSTPTEAPPSLPPLRVDTPTSTANSQCPLRVSDEDGQTNVRPDPSTRNAPVGTISTGTVIQVVEERGRWYRIERPVAGWLWADSLSHRCMPVEPRSEPRPVSHPEPRRQEPEALPEPRLEPQPEPVAPRPTQPASGANDSIILD